MKVTYFLDHEVKTVTVVIVSSSVSQLFERNGFLAPGNFCATTA